jgi:hypothetical protein
MNNCAAAAIVCIFVSVTSPSLASGAPPQLLGKTISVSYTASVPIQSRGRSSLASRNVDMRIYVSSAGRLFERTVHEAVTGYLARNNAPGQGLWRFVGGSLVKSAPAVSGAVRLQISFDSNFGSCTFSGIMGHEAGKAYRWKGLDGIDREATGPGTFSAERCSIAAGNGL